MHIPPNSEQFTNPTRLIFMLKKSGRKIHTSIFFKKNDEMRNKIQLILEQC